MVKKLLLVQPKISYGGGIASYGWCPPLGLLSLATFVRREHPGLEIEVIDEEIRKAENLEATILGLSCNISNYQRGLELARLFKDRNPQKKVVLGGPQSALGQNILRNREYIDFVVYGEDGEETLSKICAGEELKVIPNLIWRSGNEIRINEPLLLDLTKLPIPDRSFLNLEPYFDNFTDPNFSRPSSIYIQKGCPHGKCTFCYRSGQKSNFVRTRDFRQVWDEILYLHNQYGIDYIREWSDSPRKAAFLELLRTRPEEVDVNFRFYARSSDVDEETVEVLRKLGTYEVYLGIESGDEEILRRMGKGESLMNHLNAVRILSEIGIKPRGGFILGCEGETEETLERTYGFCRELFSEGLDSCACSVFTPIPYSVAWQKLMNKQGMKEKYSNADLLNPSELQGDWIANFTHVNRSLVESFVNRFLELSPRNARFY